MKISKRWLSSQILLMVIVGWVSGLAVIHHAWLVPSIKTQVARQESSVAVHWVEQCLNGLARERKVLAWQCKAWADMPQMAGFFAADTPTTLTDDVFEGLDPIGVILCDADRRVADTFGWVNQTSRARPKRPWSVADQLHGGPLFPLAWPSPQLTGLLAANGRLCLFARRPVGPRAQPRGYVVFVRPIDWPMLQDLSSVAGVNVMVADSPLLGPQADAGDLDSIKHWSSGHGTMSADVNLKDSLGRPVGRLQVAGSVLDINSFGEKVRSAYLVQLLWLITSALVTFGIVYLLFIRPLAILVRRLSDEELTQKRGRLSAGLFAETGILARKFSDVMNRIVVLSETDPLTGLTNRRQFQRLLEREFGLSQRYNTSLAALMIDIDYFKRVNDLYGHLLGDEVLQMVAGTIRDVCRKTDICGRYGGEEFAAILPQTTMDQAAILGERIRDQIIKQAVSSGLERIAVTVSVGVAAMPELPCARSDDLLNLADQALYHAKRSGRNRTVLASRLDGSAVAGERPEGQPSVGQTPAVATDP